MVLSEPEGLLRIAMADLETAEASSDPAVFREGAWGFWLQQARLLLLLGAEGVNTDDLQPLAQLTIYAVQFRYDADAAPMGLDREALNLQVKELIARVEALVVRGSEAVS
jgi:hypothetical protein